MGDEIPLCPLCHTPRMPRKQGDAWFLGCQIYTTRTAPTTTTPPVPQHFKMLLLKQQIQAVIDRIPGERMPPLFDQALGQWHGKGNHVPTVWSHHQRQGRDHGDQQVDSTDTVSLQPGGGRVHRVGSSAGRDRCGQTIAGGSPCGSTGSPAQSGRSSMPSGRLSTKWPSSRA